MQMQKVSHQFTVESPDNNGRTRHVSVIFSWFVGGWLWQEISMYPVDNQGDEDLGGLVC